MTDPAIKERLEYLRGEINAERISQGELIELQGLAPHIEEGDVQLLEWAGVPEFPELPKLPLPNDSFEHAIVIASVWQKDDWDDETPPFALLLLLRVDSPYYVVVEITANRDGTWRPAKVLGEEIYNINDAVRAYADNGGDK